jgi:hypothetical protein
LQKLLLANSSLKKTSFPVAETSLSCVTKSHTKSEKSNENVEQQNNKFRVKLHQKKN